MSSVEALTRALSARSHRRRNALTGEWVLVSPQRTLRPWLGQRETPVPVARSAYDPDCYLCPGNARADGVRNPPYDGTFVFTNDFPALTPAADSISGAHELFGAQTVSGECRVICYSPRHDLSLGDLTNEAAVSLVRNWRAQFAELDARNDTAYTLIFENRGDMMGASNPHPHGQIWATSVLPDEVERELERQSAYRTQHGRRILEDYLEAEIRIGSRIVRTTEHWVALVPFWAVWPFELLVLPRRQIASFDEITPEEEMGLAKLLGSVVGMYDRVFDVPFPYSMGWHPRPSDRRHAAAWTLHAHFYPPLLRSSTVRKFQVGFEILGMPQRDFTPESAAERLRAVAT
ncbi:MAG: UDP-glucose--hexose-1-phosphate uridylyltransferase [Steroidobacteraceae bacterium]